MFVEKLLNFVRNLGERHQTFVKREIVLDEDGGILDKIQSKCDIHYIIKTLSYLCKVKIILLYINEKQLLNILK